MKTTKRIFLGLLILIIISILIFLGITYTNYLKDTNSNKTFLIPRLETIAIQIQNITDNKIDLLAGIQIANHSPVAFTLDSLKYTVFISSIKVASSNYSKQITIKTGNDNIIELPISIFNKTLTTILKNEEHKGIDSVEYEIKTTLFINSGLKKTIDLDFKKRMPLIYIPEITVDKIEVDSLRFSGVTLIVHSTFVNKNAFPLDAIDLHDRFNIDGIQWLEAFKPGLTKIPPQSKTEIVLPFKISFKNIAHTFPELIKKGKNIPYAFEINFKINSENNTTKNSKVKLESKGTIKELLKDYKKIKQ